IAEKNIQLMWAILIATGMRTGELRALRWEDLKTDRDIPYFAIRQAVKHDKKTPDGLPVVGAPKTDNGIRDVPIMHPGALEIILSAKQDSGYIIKPVRDSGKKEQPLSEQQISRLSKTFNVLYWKPATTQDRLTPYDFRKTMLTVFNNAGVSVKSSHTMAGHADEDFTQRTYVNSSWEQIVIDAKKVMKWFDEVTK
ncbi:MAG: tyrosine-type recombinase/integrase, partial [Clostridia bacterium]|nr:tyrosine-type recombinase/integrase [Clostridia bacterium]